MCGADSSRLARETASTAMLEVHRWSCVQLWWELPRSRQRSCPIAPQNLSPQLYSLSSPIYPSDNGGHARVGESIFKHRSRLFHPHPHNGGPCSWDFIIEHSIHAAGKAPTFEDRSTRRAGLRAVGSAGVTAEPGNCFEPREDRDHVRCPSSSSRASPGKTRCADSASCPSYRSLPPCHTRTPQEVTACVKKRLLERGSTACWVF